MAKSIKRDLETMTRIMLQKEKDIARTEQQSLNPEGREMAKYKRFTFDVITTPTDPLR